MYALTPEQRSLRASIAAHEMWANCDDPAARTLPARAAFLHKFEEEADPDRTLTPAERARRAEHLRKAYFQRLALASSRARAAKGAARKAGGSDA
ncbi:hypothetical protein ACTWQF_28430 [Streptomyces sp. 8N114]|uniref:hypothetical protein n=1 Tax=Streptomyces sp. 8N114 TaxID=3457419 RepID=UPI003FD3CBFE